jgi:hypothetical protein
MKGITFHSVEHIHAGASFSSIQLTNLCANPGSLTVSLCPDYHCSDGLCWLINHAQLIFILTIVHLSCVDHLAYSRSNKQAIYGMDGASQGASSSIIVFTQTKYGVGSTFVRVRPERGL